MRMSNIKTTERVSLVQVKLNNLFRVATNSAKGDLFEPQPIIDHWINLSIKAGQNGQTAPIILQEGQQIPNIFKLKSTYSTSRKATGSSKAVFQNKHSETKHDNTERTPNKTPTECLRLSRSPKKDGKTPCSSAKKSAKKSSLASHKTNKVRSAVSRLEIPPKLSKQSPPLAPAAIASCETGTNPSTPAKRQVLSDVHSNTPLFSSSKKLKSVEKAAPIVLSPFPKANEIVIPACTHPYSDRDHRNKRNVAKDCMAFFKNQQNATLFEGMVGHKDGSILQQMVLKWCQHPIHTNPFFVTIACTGKDVMSSSLYDFSAVLSRSYVSDNFISNFQKIIPELFDGQNNVLFLDPSLWTQLAELGTLARFQRNLTLNYYDYIFWNIHIPSIALACLLSQSKNWQ